MEWNYQLASGVFHALIEKLKFLNMPIRSIPFSGGAFDEKSDDYSPYYLEREAEFNKLKFEFYSIRLTL